MAISIAMAAFNGAAHIAAQIESILPQLGAGDELVISCDPSQDGTEKIIASFAAKDCRIEFLCGPGEGILPNFQEAIFACKNDFIFLCDQDDVWLESKVAIVLAEFERSQVSVVLHDAKIVNEDLDILHESFFRSRNSKKGFLRNIIKNSYIGCCMAFRRELKDIVLPFPKDIPMHDQWIGLMGEKYGGVSFLNEPLVLYRRHKNNVSKTFHAGFAQMLKWRINLIRSLNMRTKYEEQ